MKLDNTALLSQIEQEFEELWKSTFTFYGKIPDTLSNLVDKYVKQYYKLFYVKGYKNGWETCMLYRNSTLTKY